MQELARQKPGELANVEQLRRTATGLGHRAALLWCGDLSIALSMLDVGKGGRELVDSPMALELVAWSVSEHYLKLRERLGLALVSK